MHFNKWIALSGFIMLLALSGCKTKGIKPSQVSKEGLERVETSLSRQLQYETLTGKADLSLLIDGKRINSRAEIRMIKDKYIQISAQPLLGIEVARLTISPDTLLLIDRMGKQFVCEEITSVQSVLPKEINFNALQSLLTNQIFDVQAKKLTAKDALLFSQKKTTDGLLSISTQNGKRVDYDFILNSESSLIQTDVLTKTGSKLLECKYDTFKKIDNGQLFPFNMSLSFSLKGKPVNADINYLSLNVDRKTDISFSIPNRYKKLKVQDILSMLLKN